MKHSINSTTRNRSKMQHQSNNNNINNINNNNDNTIHRHDTNSTTNSTTTITTNPSNKKTGIIIEECIGGGYIETNQQQQKQQQQQQQPSFIPPIAQRRIKLRQKRQRKENIRRLIIFFCIILIIISSIVYNIKYIIPRFFDTTQTITYYNENDVSSNSLRGGEGATKPWVSLDSQPFNSENHAKNAQHLILVAGHSVTISGHLQDAGEDENDWYLLDYQKGQGLPQAIIAHIKAGIKEAHNDPNSLLIFSGGETRSITGPLTEGSSYFHVADAMSLWNDNNNNNKNNKNSNTVRARTTTEEYATDSFENLMFSICRFYEVTNHYPTKITIISFSFKQERFEKLHIKAIGWPNTSKTFKYIGVDPPITTGFNINNAMKGELEHSIKPFQLDPYGCNSNILQQKRHDRNPFSRTPPYQLSCPTMKELLSYCGPNLISSTKLPWGRETVK